MFDRFSRKIFVVAIAVGAVAALDHGAARADGDAAAKPAPAVAMKTVVRSVKVGLNKSLVIDLPRDARDVLVSNPVIADAVIRTPRRIYLTGVAVGQANIIVFDKAGQQIVTLDLSVERDTGALVQMLHQLLPDSNINIEIVSDNIVLSGTVKSATDARKAADIANIFANGGSMSQSANANSGGGSSGGVSVSVNDATAPAPTSSVVNLLTIDGEDQVNLKVTVAEVQRTAVKQLGVDWSFQNFDLGNGGALSGAVSNPFGVNSTPAGSLTSRFLNNSIGATVRGLEQTGLMRTLAEPTLTAISGESASFLAGGEFPVPVGVDQSNNVTIQFKPFGVSLAFTPVVLSEGRISLHVKTEVSELSNEGAVSLGSLSIPSLKVRRAETTTELPSGGSMVMAGLLQDNVKQSLAGLPGLKNLPVLGTLFRSRDYQRNETELVIIVTPYMVKPVARTALAQPDDGFNPAPDGTATFLGRLNRVYGVQGQPPPAGTYNGRYGFIFE